MGSILKSKRFFYLALACVLAAFCFCMLASCGEDSSEINAEPVLIIADISGETADLVINVKKKQVSFTVPSGTTSFDIARIVPEEEVEATCVVYSDSKPPEVLDSPVPLAVGENVFYPVYTVDGKSSGYTFVVTREVPPHVHEFGSWQTLVEATCITPGRKKRVCECGETETAEIPALGHSFGSWRTVTEATCLTDGRNKRVCSRCKAEEYEVVESLGHNVESWEVVTEPTCTERGIRQGTCSLCEELITESVEKLGHTAVTDRGYAPACERAGLTDGSHCSVCGEVFSEQKTIPATGHVYGDWRVATSETCTADGTEERFCLSCGERYTRSIAKLGHNYVVTVTEPTCTEDGYTTHKCSRCNDEYVDAVVHALGHDLVHHEKLDPTCTESGWSAYDTCSRCDYTTFESLLPLGHTFGAWVDGYDATCLADGLYGHYYCSACDASYDQEETLIPEVVIPALGHDYEDVVTEPTCLEGGYTTHTCSRCNDVYVGEETLALGHDYENVVTEPTCLEEGYTTHTCSRCGDSFVDTQTDPLGHDYEDVVTAPTCLEEGYTTHTCSRCDDSYTDTPTPSLGHNYIASVTGPTCTVDGYTTHACSRCAEFYTDTIVPALGHDLEHHAGQDPTCTESGWEEYDTCTRCDYTTYEEIEPLGHDLVHHDGQTATCTESGWEEYDTCSRCDYTTYEEIDALGHDLVHMAGKEPTCTSAGWAEYDYCTRCSYTTFAQIDALGHDYTPSVIPPTCTDQGYTVYTCERCGVELVDDYVDAIGHTEVIDEAVPATCTESGLSQGKHCSVCNAVLVPQTEVSALGHRYVDGECVRCGYIATETTGLIFALVGDTYEVVGYTGDSSDVHVLAQHDGKDVASVAAEAFQNCTVIRRLWLPTTVTSIGAGAFAGCSSLEELTVPFVGNRSGVTDLSTYQYPIGYIFGTDSYSGAIATQQEYYSDLTTSTTKTTFYLPNSLYSVSVLSGYIPYGAFSNCIRLTDVVLGNNVTAIGRNACKNATSLTSVEVPSGVTSIGANAYAGCTALRSVSIPTSVTTIGVDAFANCPIEEATIPYSACSFIKNANLTTVTVLNGTALPANAFMNCVELTEVNLPNGLLSVGDSAFEGCENLISISLPNTVTTLGNRAFFGCVKLESIAFSGVVNLGTYCFNNCRKLRLTELPAGITVLPEAAFRYCSSLTGISLDHVVEIGDKAFYHCDRLQTLTLGEDVTTIGVWAFRDCTSLATVVIESTIIAEVGEYAFRSCPVSEVTAPTSALTYLPKTTIEAFEIYGAETVAASTFAGCTSLESVIVGEDVVALGASAFADCSSLVEVYVSSASTAVNANAFLGSSIETLWIPVAHISAVRSGTIKCLYLYEGAIPNEALTNYESLEELYLSDSVTSIGSRAFAGCTSLATVSIEPGTTVAPDAFEGCDNLVL